MCDYCDSAPLPCKCDDENEELAEHILRGNVSASAAMGRKGLYGVLNAGKSASTGGRLPFLGTSSKIEAGSEVDVLSTVLYMQPAMVSGREACSGRSAGCTDACLAESVGRMSMTCAQKARRRRHASFFADRGRFLSDLAGEIERHRKRAIKLGKIPAVRLNGTTDLPWHRMAVIYGGVSYPNIHAAFPDVRFYEYTKQSLGQLSGARGLPANLHVTFSLSDHPESNARALDYLRAGHNVAAVTFTERHVIPGSFYIAHTTWGPQVFPTVDGDAHDARFLDPKGHVVILAAKGRAKHDTTGFVRYPTSLPLAMVA